MYNFLFIKNIFYINVRNDENLRIKFLGKGRSVKLHFYILKIENIIFLTIVTVFFVSFYFVYE